MESNHKNIFVFGCNLRMILLTVLLFVIGCGPLARLDVSEKGKDFPQTKLEKEYHKSLYWGGAKGIYVSIKKGSSSIGRQTFAKVKVMNYSGANLLLDTENDRYWFERYGSKFSLYRRSGGRYPKKISNNKNIEFELLGIDSFTGVSSISVMFLKMDSLEINLLMK